jgi:hypothetical protein
MKCNKEELRPPGAAPRGPRKNQRPGGTHRPQPPGRPDIYILRSCYYDPTNDSLHNIAWNLALKCSATEENNTLGFERILTREENDK